MTEDSIEFWQSGEWTMVYLNGTLVHAGSHYLADEWLQARCGVKVVDDEAGVCIPDGHNAIRSLVEVRAAEEQRNARLLEAQEKRTEADRLIAEAQALEASK